MQSNGAKKASTKDEYEGRDAFKWQMTESKWR